MRALYYIFIIIIFTSCSSAKYISIETQNPAQITFPQRVKRVLMVNNAVSQPNNSGYRLVISGKEQDTLRIESDKAIVELCKSLGKKLADSPYFSDVLLYDGTTREDNNYLSDNKLSSSLIETLCNDNNTDAIISVDKLLFHLDEDITRIPTGESDVAVNLTSRIRGIVRSYIPGREAPLATVLIEDSIEIGDNFPNMVILSQYFPSPQEAITITAQYIGEKLTPNFIPYWQEETRWIYRGESTKWKEATAYASSGNWDKAYQLWSAIYKKTRNSVQKAKAASNIALYYEMNTDLKEAYDWALKSYDLMNKAKGKDYKYTKNQELYLHTLVERNQSNQKLNMQFSQ